MSRTGTDEFLADVCNDVPRDLQTLGGVELATYDDWRDHQRREYYGHCEAVAEATRLPAAFLVPGKRGAKHGGHSSARREWHAIFYQSGRVRLTYSENPGAVQHRQWVARRQRAKQAIKAARADPGFCVFMSRLIGA